MRAPGLIPARAEGFPSADVSKGKPMSALHAFRPDHPSDSAGTFRCDQATVRQVIHWWQHNPARPIRSKTAEAERCRKWEICVEFLGNELVDNCEPYDLLDLINAQENVTKDNTRKGWSTTIQKPFNEAEKLRLITKNPFRGVSFKDLSQGRDWTDEELAKVLDESSQAFGELVIGMRLSGLRPHEACDLGWRQIRFDHGNIRIDNHKMRYRTKAPRYVPLNDPLITLFNMIKARNIPSDRVFLSPRRRPWTRPHADSTFLRLRDRIGLPDDLKLHGCRHTFITGAIMNDVGVAYLMQIAGHSDIRTTQRYVHVADKTSHLNGAMNQAVKGLNIVPATEYTPLFDGLE